MPQLTSLLTAAALLVHLLAGCCWHHAHASPVAEVALTCSCHRPDTRGEPDQQPEPPEHESCDEGRCLTVFSSVSDVSPPWDLPSLPGPQVLVGPMAMASHLALLPMLQRAACADPQPTPVTLRQLLRL